ncbi:MAG: PLP-dependent aminotransferase family protein [Oscillospiraceae bacterium]|nr:PLP-dependent aminotransferase family protein [Oscillospiraceae bacterium]
MEYVFSDNLNRLKPSIIRELLKQMSDPNLISFAGGNPAAEGFPLEDIRRISDKLLQEDGVNVLQYGVTEGYTPLRKAAVDFFSRTETVLRKNDDVAIFSGGQQIVDFTVKCLCNPGDTVICENPSFLGALNAIRSHGVNLVGIDIEADGLNVAQLEQALKTPKKPKFMYLIPNFQNPTGVTLSAEKRKAVYNLAVKYQVPILEDNPYGELRYSGEAVPSIKSLDEAGVVIYAASFSKIMCPGMRLAACIADKTLLGKMVICKQTNDVHSTLWSQRVCERILATVDMEAHLAHLRAVYKEKSQLMLSCMEQHFPADAMWTRPEGGMFVWVTLPRRIDAPQFIKQALEQGVAVVPGAAFYADDTQASQGMRMCFSTAPKEDIVRGITILGDLMKVEAKR